MKKKIQIHKSIDKANIKQYEINGLSRSDEYIYFCSVCKKLTSLDKSFSNKGHKLICEPCAIRFFPKENYSDQIFKYIDFSKLLEWQNKD